MEEAILEVITKFSNQQVNLQSKYARKELAHKIYVSLLGAHAKNPIENQIMTNRYQI